MTETANQRLLPMIFGAIHGKAIGLMAELELAELISAAPMSLDEIADHTGSNVMAMERYLRLLGHLGLVQKKDDGKFQCTEMGALLHAEHAASLHYYAHLTNTDVVLEMAKHMATSIQTGQSSFIDVFGMNFYEALQQNQQVATVFQGAMGEISTQDVPDILNHYEFRQEDIIVDIGGGHGHLLAAVLDKHEKTLGILFELPDVVEASSKVLAQHIESRRCETVKGDFLQSVPKNGTVYILKRVISQLSDDDAIVILKNIHESMSTNSRLLIIDPDPDTLYGASYNVLVLVAVGGGGLRSRDELQTLFEKTGFKYKRKLQLETELCIVEVEG